MKAGLFKAVGFFVILTSSGLISDALAASAGPALLKAKQEAETRDYVFAASHDEIVEMAKKEGKVRALASHEPVSIKNLVAAFRKKYPFLDAHVEEVTGADAAQRLLLELKAGHPTGWDATFVPQDFYREYLPYMKKFDILGMVEQRVLRIPPQIIDPVHRNMVIVANNTAVLAYNKKMISVEKIPDAWEGFLKPEFKGRKFATDIRPLYVGTGLVPAWGLEKTLDFARKLATQEPVWVRGSTRGMLAMIAGQYPIFVAPTIGAFERALARDPTKSVAYKVVEPVPISSKPDGILATAANPYSALLWMEFQASSEAQKIIDEEHQGSAIITGTFQERLTRGKKISLQDWDHLSEMGEYTKKVVEAFGFPTPTKSK
ncbi:MAG: extracellular solute-binding protein [Deltaproteobacteria bacterium]|nr:extracellular solute-binding protein [Deltaproteobacteria bacterium]